jgi:hypothetical protein
MRALGCTGPAAVTLALATRSRLADHAGRSHFRKQEPVVKIPRSRHTSIRIPRSTMQNSPLCKAVVQLLTGKADALARCRSSAFARSV